MVADSSQRSPSSDLERLTFERGRCVFLGYKNITIGVWSGQADVAAAQATERAARIMAARYRTGRSYVAFVLDGLPGPTPGATEIFTKLMGQRDSLACLAYVIEGSGFWASGLRSMIANAHRDSGAAAVLRIGTSVDDITKWLSERHTDATGVEVSEAEMRDVLLRARSCADLTRCA
jgi:hypothetical protein